MVVFVWSWALGPAMAQGLPPEVPAEASEVERRGMELYENGVILYDEGRYEDAIVAWTEGYRLTQRSGFLFNIANAQERLGDYQGAIDTLGRYRALARADERETLDRRIRNLEQRLATTPAPAPAPVVAPSVPDPVPTARPPADRRVWLAGGLVAGGAVGVGLGTVFGLESRAAGADARDLCVDTADGAVLCPATASDRLGANRRDAAVADVAFLVGTALAGTGAVVWLTGDPESGALGLRASPGGAAIAGRF